MSVLSGWRKDNYLIDIFDKILLSIRLKWYPFIHSFSCGGDMVIYMPNTDEDNECFILCGVCGRKYHLADVEQDDDMVKRDKRGEK